MTDEKAIEYQQVAALLVDQIELAELAARRSKNPMWHLEELKKFCDQIISDKEYREKMYGLAFTLYNITPKGEQ